MVLTKRTNECLEWEKCVCGGGDRGGEELLLRVKLGVSGHSVGEENTSEESKRKREREESEE